MLQGGGLCDWEGKDRPIEKVNGLRAFRDNGSEASTHKTGRGGEAALI
jgi:hypothetical protein